MKPAGKPISFQQQVVPPQLCINFDYFASQQRLRAKVSVDAGFSDSLAPKLLKRNGLSFFFFIHYILSPVGRRAADHEHAKHIEHLLHIKRLRAAAP